MPYLIHTPGDALIWWSRTGPAGRPLLCLPGLGARAGYLAGLAGHLGPGGPGLALLDFPGTGQSEPLSGCHDLDALAEVTIAVIEWIGAGPLDIFGHSLGGTVAICVAERRPDLVSSLIVAEGNLAPGGGAASSRIAAQPIEEFVASGFDTLQAKLRARGVAGDALAGALYAARRGDDPRALHEVSTALVQLRPGVLEAFLAHAGHRAFVYGARTCPETADVPPGPDAPDPATLRAAGVAVEVVPGTGHLMPIEAPEATAAAVAAHLSPRP